jgi:hypothetical protein
MDIARETRERTLYKLSLTYRAPRYQLSVISYHLYGITYLSPEQLIADN